MNTKFVKQLKEMKPVSRQEVKAAMAKKRTHQHGVVAFKSDLSPSVQSLDFHRLQASM